MTLGTVIPGAPLETTRLTDEPEATFDPAVGDSLRGSVNLSGLANVFEAQFNEQLVDGSGKVLLDAPVHATAGSGQWGSFDVTLPFSAHASSMSMLRVYDISMRDGSPIDEVDLHLPAGP